MPSRDAPRCHIRTASVIPQTRLVAFKGLVVACCRHRALVNRLSSMRGVQIFGSQAMFAHTVASSVWPNPGRIRFQSWRPHCVAGREWHSGRDRRTAPQHGTIPNIVFHYGFVKSDLGRENIVVL